RAPRTAERGLSCLRPAARHGSVQWPNHFQGGEGNLMVKRSYLLAGAFTLALVGVAAAQHPILDMLAGQVVDQYQKTSGEQLIAQRKKPKSPREMELIQMLKGDPQLRTEFINKIAGPVANKMFECGMIP